MEGILRDYLGFARPLEDLRVGAVDLATMWDDLGVSRGEGNEVTLRDEAPLAEVRRAILG